jgi:hypothetical protein
VLPLLANGGSGAMAAVHLGGIGQYQQFLTDTVDEGIKIATGQVGTANAPLKQHIAPHYKTIGCAIKTDAAGAMAGGKQYLQFIFAQLNRIAIFQIDKCAGVNIKGHIVHQAAHACIFKYFFFRGVEMGLQVVGVRHKLVAKNMVQMPVGVQQQCRLQSFLFDKSRQFLPLLGKIAAGVNNGAKALVVVQNVGIFLYGAECKCMDMYHGGIVLWCKDRVGGVMSCFCCFGYGPKAASINLAVVFVVLVTGYGPAYLAHSSVVGG